MGAVAAAPEGHRADEAGQTPRAADGTQQMAAQPQSTGGPVAEQAVDRAQPATEPESEQIQAPGFGERGRMRRRARFLRKARELAYRDLGGLVFDLHRFGQRNDPLVLAKLATLRQIDMEVRELEAGLRERRPVTVLREVGIAACPRCAAIHGSDDRFCPGCGLAFDANADRPISTAPVSSPVQAQAVAASAPAPIAAQASVSASPASTPAPTSAPASSPPPAATPRTWPERPISPAVVPVGTKPEPAQTELKEPNRVEEDEPTQILRPPAKDI
jgi:hypothetical protein